MPSDPRAVWGDLAVSAFVLACPLFKSLDEEAGADLLRVAEVVVFAPGETVVREGEPGEDMFLVRDGHAAVTVEAGGARREIAFLDRGALFGEIAAAGAVPRSASVTARSELSVVRFPGPVVAALAERFPKMAKLLDALRHARHREA